MNLERVVVVSAGKERDGRGKRSDSFGICKRGDNRGITAR